MLTLRTKEDLELELGIPTDYRLTIITCGQPRECLLQVFIHVKLTGVDCTSSTWFPLRNWVPFRSGLLVFRCCTVQRCGQVPLRVRKEFLGMSWKSSSSSHYSSQNITRGSEG